MKKIITFVWIVLFFGLIFVSKNLWSEETGNFKKYSKYKLLIKLKTKPYEWEFSPALALGLPFEPLTLTIGVSARIGYFIGNNIEIEPEINLMYNFSEYYSFKKIKPFYLVNLSHNIFISSKLIAFTLGGVGFSIIKERGGGIFLDNKEEIGWLGPINYRMAYYFVWNVGAGIKWFQSKIFALRFECRFMNVKEGPTYVVSYLRIFMGISVFLINNSN